MSTTRLTTSATTLVHDFVDDEAPHYAENSVDDDAPHLSDDFSARPASWAGARPSVLPRCNARRGRASTMLLMDRA